MRQEYRLLIAFLLIGAALGELEVFTQSFNTNDFKDLDGWTALGNARADLFNVCSNIRIVGGDGVFGKGATMLKHFKLPPHHTLQLKVQFWKVDSWDNEEFHVWVDNQVLFQQKFIYHQGEQLCGRGHAQWNEQRINIDAKIAHTGATAVVLFTSTLDQGADDESWGIRDFQLFIDKCPEKCHTCSNGNEAECSMWDVEKWFWTDLSEIGAEGWSVDGARADKTQCGGISMFGGFGLFGKGALIKNRIKLGPHYRLKIKLLMAKIDSWDNERGILKVDGAEAWSAAFAHNQGYWNNICGQASDWRELLVRVEVEVAHSKSDVLLEFTSTLNEAPENESWGIRDFFLYTAQCAKDCAECSGPKGADCTKCANNWSLQNGECQPLSQFILLEQSFLEDKFTGLSDWVLKSNEGGRTTSECDGKTLIGGFNVFGAKASASKTFKLPNHKRLRIMVQIWKIDSWDGESLFVKIDGSVIWTKAVSFATGGKPMCGQGHANWNELIYDVDEIIAHSGNEVQVELTSSLDQGAADESWGFREFKIFYEAKEECAIFYSECGYKGASFEFCEKSPDFRKDSVPPTIRSIQIPPQSRVTLYEKTEYGGRKVTYSESQECIKAFDFAFLQMSGPAQGEWVEVPANALQGRSIARS